MNHEYYMKIAMEEAETSVKEGSYPFSVVVVNEAGEVVYKDHDRVKEYTDPTAHGEVNAIRYLCKKLDTLNLSDFVFYTTSEPCSTCFSSMIKAKVKKVVYGCKTEASASLPISINELAERSNQKIEIIGGILEKECLEQRNKYRL